MQLIEKQNEAMLLWLAGDYREAVDRTAELYRLFPNERRGKAAYFHVGNQLEHTTVPEAETPERLNEILKAAREYYRKAREIPGQEAVARDRSRERMTAVDVNLARLAPVLSGTASARDAGPILGGMEASRAAAAYIKEALPRTPDHEADLAHFLLVVYQLQFAEDMAHKLGEGVKRFRGSRPELLTRTRERYIPLLVEAARETQRWSGVGSEKFPRSRYAPEFAHHRAQGCLYEVYALIARMDAAREAGNVDEARELGRSAAPLLDQAAGSARETGRLAMSAAAVAATDAPLLGVVPRRVFEMRRYNKLAATTLAEAKGLRFGFARGMTFDEMDRQP